MRPLTSITEFTAEAASAVFTKQQAVAATLQILTKELNNTGNSAEDIATIQNAINKAEFRYIDATKTETDRMLDTLGVARFTTQDIVNGINALLFDAQ